MAEQINFQQLTINSRDEIDDFISKFESYSDFNFASLFSWNTDSTTRYSFHEDNLIIELADYLNNEPIVSLLGETNIDETIKAIFDYLHNQGRPQEIKLVPEITVNNINNTSYRYIEDPKNHDYILSTHSLAAMKASEYRGKRSGLNSFKKKFEATTKTEELELLAPSLTQKIENLLGVWKNNSQKTDEEVQSEFSAIKNFLRYSKELKVEGIGIYDKESLIGFSLIELGQKYGTIHFEKADTTYRGVYEYLKQVTAQKMLDNAIEFINYEQDLGIPGLRRAKESHHPVKFLKKYIVSLS